MSRPTHVIVDAALRSAPFVRLLDALPGRGEEVRVGGAPGSAGVVAGAALGVALPTRVIVLLAADPQQADEIEADLEVLLGPEASALYPQREALPYEEGEPHREIGGLRVEAVEALFARGVRYLVTTGRALQELAPIPDQLAGLRLSLRVGDPLGLQDFADALEHRGFDRVPLVEQVGQFAVRGGIVDAFSFGSAGPMRVEFWGDEIASLRFFDILDQRSVREVDEAHILPVDFRVDPGAGPVSRHSLLDLLPPDALLIPLGGSDFSSAAETAWSRTQELYGEILETGVEVPPPAEIILPPREFLDRLVRFPRVAFEDSPDTSPSLAAIPPPEVDRRMDRLSALLRSGAAKGMRTLLLCDNDGQLQRLEEILEDSGGIPPGAQLAIGTLAGGFELPVADPPLRVLTDHEVFRRSRRVRRSRGFRGAVALESLAQLVPGDHVVHLEHGVGRFRGLERVTVGGEEIEALAVEYAGGEVLRVPVDRIELIERWVGADEESSPPSLHRIGGRRWKNLRRKTEAAIEQMTAELLELYARREAGTGFRFSPDTRWQREMESSFLYEDTPDQRTATEDVKRDMQSDRPMDRLICGDVGYGKTEIAMRAAFKAVQDGKQVAFVAPTTILVEQHRHTVEERLADYPVRVAALSRFRTPKEQRRILEELAAGRIDILVGTHRALGEDVRFHDLGLLIVDEEQRFGVRHKERLKQLRASVDVLTLTATPIPRTLYLSLTGIRDLTLIRTPPRDRMPILTHLLPWNEHLLRDAIGRELDRGGQVFFLHNRVETIDTVAERVRKLAPEATVGIGHGQMGAAELDEVMRQFVDGELDILVCTSIIENGLDVPNANTLVVDRADRFGLAQLYQIRGRVGRSDRRAYCYLLVPEGISEEALARLRVLEHHTELGSGYAVALRDLEMRGAGNLLGADQSGFAHQVGIDTYLRLVERAVRGLREAGDPSDAEMAEVSVGGAAYLPDRYISDSGQKLHLYRRLSRVEGGAEVDAMAEELRDRYGPPPPEVERLLLRSRLSLLGRGAGVARIFLSQRDARIHFSPGTVPRLVPFEQALAGHAVEVQVARMSPLVLRITPDRPEDLPGIVTTGLNALVRERRLAS